MRRAIFLFLLFGSLLSAKDIAIVPGEPSALNPNIYRSSGTRSEADYNAWQFAHKKLIKKGINFTTSDLGGEDLKFKNCKYVVFFNLPTWITDWEKKLKCIPKRKRVLLAYESPAFMPEMFSQKMLNRFAKVITWDDALVDNKKYFKFSYAPLQQMIPDTVPFEQKKLLTQISGNKRSKHKDELYSKRLKVIRFFEKKDGDDFEFYGTGWQDANFRHFKGEPRDKIFALKNYRFCMCYENIGNIKGYITEKIFDCFKAGVVPIYLGASNVKDFIPKECFIDRRRFKSFKALYKYLKNMDESEYNLYIAHIQAYLTSKKAQKFSQQAFAKSLLKAFDI